MAYFVCLFFLSLLFRKGYVSLSQVVKRTRNKLAPWENSCSSSEAVLPWLFSMKLSRMWLLAAFPALSQSCKKLKSRLIAACSFIEIMVNQSWGWLQREERQTGYQGVQNQASPAGYSRGFALQATNWKQVSLSPAWIQWDSKYTSTTGHLLLEQGSSVL